MKNKKDQRKKVSFFKVGGTWDMSAIDGKLEGTGIIDDKSLKSYEEKLGYFTGKVAPEVLEWNLAQHIENIINTQAKTGDICQSLPWIKDLSLLVKGTYTSIFSGDSSQLRTSLIAPIVSFLLQYRYQHPEIVILGAQGTDTADISLLPLLDVYTFDTKELPILFTGSNRLLSDHNSDAPAHFYDLVRIATKELPAGAYWIFSGNLFNASDFVKISPLEARIVDNFSTFYSPHLKSVEVETVLESKDTKETPAVTSKDHVIATITMKKLYNAMTQVHIVDLSEQREIGDDINAIENTKYKAVIVVGHSFGNVNNPIKNACRNALLNNKLVIIVSRCFISEVNQQYSASLLGANSSQLRSKGKKIISAFKLNKNVAKALAIRAVQENLNPFETETLFNKYAICRGLSEQDIIIVYPSSLSLQKHDLV